MANGCDCYIIVFFNNILFSLLAGGVAMKPSEQCKAAGLKSLAELAKVTGESVQTLINWHRDKPIRFKAMIMYAVNRLAREVE